MNTSSNNRTKASKHNQRPLWRIVAHDFRHIYILCSCIWHFLLFRQKITFLNICPYIKIWHTSTLNILYRWQPLVCVVITSWLLSTFIFMVVSLSEFWCQCGILINDVKKLLPLKPVGCLQKLRLFTKVRVVYKS